MRLTGLAQLCLKFFIPLTQGLLFVQGTMKIYPAAGVHAPVQEISGSGHHGIDYVGVASVRSGKGMRMGPVPDTSVVKIM